MECLQENEGTKKGRDKKWCYYPSDLDRNHCEVIGTRCGGGGFKKVKDVSKCPIVHNGFVVVVVCLFFYWSC